MNWCSLAFFLGNFHLFCLIRADKARQKKYEVILSIYSLLLAIIYSTGFQKYLYFGKFGFLPVPGIFRTWYALLHKITVLTNLFIWMVSLGEMLLIDLKKELVPEMIRIKRIILLVDAVLVGLYFYMYFSLPDTFLWMSRSTGYISYRSLRVGPYVKGMRAVTWLIVVFLAVLSFYLYQYQEKTKKVRQEEYVFSSIVASSEISTRVFSHYIKNELLGILAETESLEMKIEGHMPELKNIHDSCQEMYDHLNKLQKDSIRIVLNQSRQNLAEVITKAVEENRTMLEKECIEIIWEDGGKNADVFCDSYYIREVFRNIFHNAMEAMRQAGRERRICVQMKVYEDEAEVVISDTGPGIPKSVENRLFDPFVSTKSTKQNWGIGLSFCKRIVTSHRGRIYAENAGEKGAAFHIIFPVVEGGSRDGT